MLHEISQFDIPNRQLLVADRQPGTCKWTDIGNAQVTHTVFGRIKIRVIREQDKNRRTWLLAALAMTALAAAAWQGWTAWQQNEPQQNPAPPLPLSARIRISAPTPPPEYISPSATPSSLGSKPGTQSQTGINTAVTNQRSGPQPPPGSKTSMQMAAKPVTPQPLTASKPQAATLATNNNSLKTQTDIQQPPRLSAPIQPITPTAATTPSKQPAANRSAAIVSPGEPLNKESTSTLTPASGNQPSSPVNAQP